jgi:hypothetical protein
MKYKVWFFLLVLLCGSAATLSAFAYDQTEVTAYGGELEISSDQATKDKMDAVEAAETCKADCTKAETATCDANQGPNFKAYRTCLRNIALFCERQCN